MTPPPPSSVRFAWWNVNNFAHYDVNRAGEDRWPMVPAAYDAKCARVDAALRHLLTTDPPDVLGLGEITSAAAEALRSRLLPDYRLIFPEVEPGTFQIAVYFRSGARFQNRMPLIAADVPRSTRSMAVADYTRGGHCVRFIFCHWTAFGDNSQLYRERLAETVSVHAYEFMNNPRRIATTPHLVVLGDFNVEPFDPVFRDRLHAGRDRDRARQRAHPSDRDVRRVRFYNASWRFLGERHPHDAIGSPHWAGTYYNARDRAWHTYDQVLVTGGLLKAVPPYLEESTLGVRLLPGWSGTDGKPESFAWAGGNASGLSDHLPLVGRIIFPVS